MPEKRISDRNEQRRIWDAAYRAKNRDRRRQYDRERMRRRRAEEEGS